MSGKKKFGALVLIVLFVLSSAQAVLADIKLPAVISDNMVLQQQTQTPIWGWANPGEKVKVKAGWQWFAKTAIADKDGRWEVGLKTPKAGGPYTITIEAGNIIVLDNILIGEVWVCSGQSNMEFALDSVNNADQEIVAANLPKIRLFTVKNTIAEQPEPDCQGQWVECNSKTAATFSAVAYFFARELSKELDVPTGLINSSYSGSMAEAWTKKEILESDEDFKPFLERFRKVAQDPEYPAIRKEYELKLDQWQKKFYKAKTEGKPLPTDWPNEPFGPGSSNAPSGLYNGMISPLIPFSIKGVIWYQGEGNWERAYIYRKLFPAMIKNWRDDWGAGDFPFYYVQIAPWKQYYQKTFGIEVRDSQFEVSRNMPNVGMVVTSDIGDIDDVHPKNKQDVGKRLALWALAKTYGKDLVCSGPMYKSMQIEGDKIRLFFDYVDGGLVSKGGSLTCFTMAGADKNFVEAKAEIDDDTVLVSSPEVKEPVSVRFGWSNSDVPNFFNKACLPASPFRTDDWPCTTFNNR